MEPAGEPSNDRCCSIEMAALAGASEEFYPITLEFTQEDGQRGNMGGWHKVKDSESKGDCG